MRVLRFLKPRESASFPPKKCIRYNQDFFFTKIQGLLEIITCTPSDSNFPFISRVVFSTPAGLSTSTDFAPQLLHNSSRFILSVGPPFAFTPVIGVGWWPVIAVEELSRIIRSILTLL